MSEFTMQLNGQRVTVETEGYASDMLVLGVVDDRGNEVTLTQPMEDQVWDAAISANADEMADLGDFLHDQRRDDMLGEG
jgi:hypothetical protein|tara:strand:+ start:23 stop:259 length:237 start_codon:yes stop_codon:yes gene_type:complete